MGEVNGRGEGVVCVVLVLGMANVEDVGGRGGLDGSQGGGEGVL